jgi:hypothetical protein
VTNRRPPARDERTEAFLLEAKNDGVERTPDEQAELEELIRAQCADARASWQAVSERDAGGQRVIPGFDPEADELDDVPSPVQSTQDALRDGPKLRRPREPVRTEELDRLPTMREAAKQAGVSDTMILKWRRSMNGHAAPKTIREAATLLRVSEARAREWLERVGS